MMILFNNRTEVNLIFLIKNKCKWFSIFQLKCSRWNFQNFDHESYILYPIFKFLLHLFFVIFSIFYRWFMFLLILIPGPHLFHSGSNRRNIKNTEPRPKFIGSHKKCVVGLWFIEYFISSFAKLFSLNYFLDVSCIKRRFNLSAWILEFLSQLNLN